MLGPDGASKLILQLLRREMPGKLDEIRERRGWDLHDLPDVETWLEHEPRDIGIDVPPMVLVIPQNTNTVGGVVRDYQDGAGGTGYRFRYQFGLFGWGIGDDYETTAAATLAYGLALREIVLQTQGIGDPDVDLLRLVPEQIVETYSPVGRDSADNRMYIAGVAVNVQYDSFEVLPSKRRGTPGAGGVVDIGPGA